MNRNFLKISIGVVVLILVMTLCLTGCDDDLIVKELDTLKVNIDLREAEVDDAIAKLETAVNTLKTDHETDMSDKVTALDAAISDAKAVLEAADTANKTALETSLKDAKSALQAAIDAVATDLENAKSALSAKIDANDTRIDTEVNKLHNAISEAQKTLAAADTANKTALNAALTEAKTALQSAIDAVATDLENAKSALSAKIDTNDTRIDTEVNKLYNAISEAQKTLAAADTANMTALEKAIESAKAELEEALENVKEELLEKIDILENNAKEEDIKLSKEIADVKEALENAVATDVESLIDMIDEANAAIDKNTQWITDYKNTTDMVVEAVFELERKFNLFADSAFCWGDFDWMPIEYAREEAKIYLYRAINEDDIEAAMAGFQKAIDDLDTPELRRLREIYSLLMEVKTDIDERKLDLTVENLASARALLDEIGFYECTECEFSFDVLIIDGEKIDLFDMYAEYRLTVISLFIDSAENALDDNDTEAADVNLEDARSLIDEVIADGMTTVLDEVELVDKYIEARVAVIETYIGLAADAILSDEIDNAYDYLSQAREDINKISADQITTDLDSVIERYNTVRADIVTYYLDLADALINGDTSDEDIDEAKEYLDMAGEYLDIYKADTEVEIDVEELEDRYNALRFAVVGVYLGFAEDAINNAEVKEDINPGAYVFIEKALDYTGIIGSDSVNVDSLYESINVVLDKLYAEYVDLYAIELTAAMNEYIGHLDAIYGDIGVNNMEVVYSEYEALTDHGIYCEYFGEDASDIVKTLVETANELENCISVRETLVTHIAEGESVAEIIKDCTVETVEGTKSYSELLLRYKAVYEAFIENLDDMYESFDNNDVNRAVYDEIKAVANYADFEALDGAFMEKITPLGDYGQAFIDSVEALQSQIENGFLFNTKTVILEAKEAKDAWLAQSNDYDSVAFVIQYCSENRWTHSELVKAIYDIESEYNIWLTEAAESWKAVYTDAGIEYLTVDNLTIYETRLESVRDWFELYPLDATEEIYGREEDLLHLEELEAKLETLKEIVAAEAERVQEILDDLKGSDTLTADREDVYSANEAYNAWLFGTYNEDINAEQLVVSAGSEFDTVDPTNLRDSLDRLDYLDGRITEIKGYINNLAVPQFDEGFMNYFADEDMRDSYAQTVQSIDDELQSFKAENGQDITVFTHEELKKLEDCKFYAEKYDSLFKLNAAYADIVGRVTDSVTLGKIESYYNDSITRMQGIHSESIFKDSEGNVVTTTTPSIQIAIIGNNAADDFETISG